MYATGGATSATQVGMTATPKRAAARRERILVATDLGVAGDAATQVAIARAPKTDADLAVCHVCSDCIAGEARVREHLRELMGSPATGVDVLVHQGEPAEQIAKCAASWHADLVVIGRPEHPTGILRRLFRPGVVDQVLRYAPCRVLVTRREPASGVVIVGVDADQPNEVLEAAAVEIAHRAGGSVIVAHWLPPVGTAMTTMGDGAVPVVPWEDLVASALPPIEAAVRQAGLRAEVRVMAGDAGHGLCDLAGELAADLVIVGTHGRSGLARLALGSVAERVANEAPSSVMVVRLGDNS
jgi:nucleotide-binding universal stress UspA family protein